LGPEPSAWHVVARFPAHIASPATHAVGLHVAEWSFSRQNSLAAQCSESAEVVPSAPQVQALPSLQKLVFGTQPMSRQAPSRHT
jgi:hypothetical protein